MAKRKNVQDATLKNIRLLKARVAKLEAKVKRLDAAVVLDTGWNVKPETFKKGDIITVSGGRMFTVTPTITGKRR